MNTMVTLKEWENRKICMDLKTEGELHLVYMCVQCTCKYNVQSFNQSDGKTVKFPLNYHYNLYRDM